MQNCRKYTGVKVLDTTGLFEKMESQLKRAAKRIYSCRIVVLNRIVQATFHKRQKDHFTQDHFDGTSQRFDFLNQKSKHMSDLSKKIGGPRAISKEKKRNNETALTLF